MTLQDNMTAQQRLVNDYSLEITGKDKDVESLTTAAPLIPAGTKVNVTFLGNEDLPMRVAAAKAVKELGFTPVPHIAARRIPSKEALAEFLSALKEIGATEHIFAVGGDPAEPEGIYDSSLSLIESGLFPEFGIKEVSIAGYPEGHPDISRDDLWYHLESKYKTLTEQGLGSTILTQFAFDIDPVMSWMLEVRKRGVDSVIRIGTPGPAGIKRLLNFATRFGIGANAMIVKKYGFSLTNLLGTAGPDKFVTELADNIAAEPSLEEVDLHFYAFGGIDATVEWAHNYALKNASA